MINNLEKNVLEHRDNDLAYIVKSFLISNEECWHIDRHVIQIEDYPLISYSISIMIPVCQVALSLLKKWKDQRDVLINEVQCNISIPYLIIDDEWLKAYDNATPPHVYICLGKKNSCIPVKHELAAKVEKTDNRELNQILPGNNYILKRLPATFGEKFGAWIVENSYSETTPCENTKT
jgi:hypothetical protein